MGWLDGALHGAAAYDRLVVAYRNGAPVRIRDIGRAIDDVDVRESSSFFGNEQGMMMAVYRQPGSNTVKIVDEIKKALPRLRLQIPAAISIDVMYDRSLGIRQSIEDVEFTLMLAACLVVLVIFLFLRNLTATLIASVALPISLIGTFSAMYLFGFSLNNLSLMALTLSVGFVVDDAIVMPDVEPLLQPILYTLPLQLLAYHIAVLKGTDVDQPRNLAKSVTVE